MTTSLPFSIFLALRFLVPRRLFVFVITLISILGAAFAIWALIVVISVMRGFDLELQRAVIGFEPEVSIETDGVIDNWRQIIAGLKNDPDVVAAAPCIKGAVIAECNQHVQTPVLLGIDPQAELKVIDIKSMIKEGSYNLSGDSVILGRGLADALDAKVGDKITITGPGNLREILEEVQKSENSQKRLSDLKDEVVMPADVTVTGIFESGRYEYDANFLFVPLPLGQELWAMEDSVHSISVKAADPYAATDRLKARLDRSLRDPEFALTWYERNQDRFDAIKVERTTMFFLLLIIVIVAAFGIMNTLIIITVMKTREIGILKALGANPFSIVSVFMLHGMTIGLFGIASGILAGIGTIHFRNDFLLWLRHVTQMKIFPASIYEFSEIPAKIVPHDILIISISGFIICSLAAFFPAWFASRLDPVEALRYE